MASPLHCFSLNKVMAKFNRCWISKHHVLQLPRNLPSQLHLQEIPNSANEKLVYLDLISGFPASDGVTQNFMGNCEVGLVSDGEFVTTKIAKTLDDEKKGEGEVGFSGFQKLMFLDYLNVVKYIGRVASAICRKAQIVLSPFLASDARKYPCSFLPGFLESAVKRSKHFHEAPQMKHLVELRAKLQASAREVCFVKHYFLLINVNNSRLSYTAPNGMRQGFGILCSV